MISIVAGGQLAPSMVGALRRGGVLIGVDRGALWLLKHRLVPQVAIGDFDSVSSAEFARIKREAGETIRHPARKDATDLELAVDRAIALRPQRIRIYGALGGRFDHALGAAHMLLRITSHNIFGEIVDNFNKITVVSGVRRLVRDRQYRYVSLLPLGGPAVVALRGFLYSSPSVKLPVGSTLGVSNEIRGAAATIIVQRGSVLVVQSIDTPRLVR